MSSCEFNFGTDRLFHEQSLSFDWQFITTTCFYYPLQALTNAFIGWLGCIVLFMGLYYGNIWNAKNFPFLSQQLFSANSTEFLFDVYNQSVGDSISGHDI